MNSKVVLSNYLRNFYLIFAADKLRYFFSKYKNLDKNKKFLKKNSNVKLPPDYLIYESFHLDYDSYYDGGLKTAIWLKEKFEKFVDIKNANILDWGCGPARVVRHFPVILERVNMYATDYNQNSINWNKNNIQGVNFNLNTLEANLPYKNDFFDVIYGISIFTHLSQEKHREWAKELFRILKPGGILFLTLQGKAFEIRLTTSEKKIFDAGNIVVRDRVKEGHRTFSAFHPDDFAKKLFSAMTVLEHTESFAKKKSLEQDIWIFRK